MKSHFGVGEPMAQFYEIEAEIRFLTTVKNARNTGAMSGARRQFYFDGNDEGWDGITSFPDFPDGIVPYRDAPVRVLVRFHRQRWDGVPADQITIGMVFEVRDGTKVMGRGNVIRA